MACEKCRLRKVKCDRARPTCLNCARRSLSCGYNGERRKRQRLDSTKVGVAQSHVEGDHQGVEGLIAVHQMTRPDPNFTSVLISSREGRDQPSSAVSDVREAAYLSPESTDSHVSRPYPQMNVRSDMAEAADYVHDHTTSMTCSITGLVTPSDSLLDIILGNPDVDSLPDCNPSVWIRTDTGDEYTGPSSGISTMSELGMNWIRKRVQGSDELCGVFEELRTSVLSLLTQPKCVGPGPWCDPVDSTPKKPLPSVETMWEYVRAYFSSVQIIFPILDQTTFEAELLAFTADQTRSTDSWNALLFAVLASGCRASLSDETASAFQESGSEAWGYFLNALSYERKLMHEATDLTAVKALVVMTTYAQGISSPQRLEYTLCSTASRLAQSLGLNRCPSPEWGLTESEKDERSRVFWVVYCLDKTIALRCGRPSVIHDYDISCSFPLGIRLPQPGDRSAHDITDDLGQKFDFFLCFTVFARLCGKISLQLYSAAALCLRPVYLEETANQLLSSLKSWQESIPASIRPGQPFGRCQVASGAPRMQTLVLHFSYYYALCAIYRRFTPLFCQDNEEIHLEHSVGEASITHIEAARSMVLLTKYIDVETYSPGW